MDKPLTFLLEQAIKQLMQRTIPPIEAGKWWGRAFTAYYSPHIKIFARMLLAEIQWHHDWRALVQLARFLKLYREDLETFERLLPELGLSHPLNDVERARVVELLERVDGILRGTFSVCEEVKKQVAQVNEKLSLTKRDNVFDFVAADGAVTNARNDVCLAAAGLFAAFEKLKSARNRLALIIGIAPMLGRPARRWEQVCEHTALF